MDSTESAFTKEHSAALKGVAILLMMLHHSFLKGRFEEFTVSFYPFDCEFVTGMASVAKICVSIFVFITGYGLAKAFSYEKLKEKGKVYCGRWTAARMIKLMWGYWFIYVLSCIVCQMLDGRVWTTYFEKNTGTGITQMLIDFLGLATAFDTPTLNGTWWYMSIAVWFVVLVPLCVTVGRKYGCLWLLLLTVLVSHIPGSEGFDSKGILVWLLPLVLGVVCAEQDWIGRMDSWLQNQRLWKRVLVLICGWALIAVVTDAYNGLNTTYFYEVKWGLYPFLLIIMLRFSLLEVKLIRKLFGFLGTYSMDIFLTHTFIRQYYCKAWIYSTGHFALSILLLLASSLVLSIVLGWLKKLIGLDKGIQKVCERITG